MAHGRPEIATIALNIDRLMRRIHTELQRTAETFDTFNVGPIGGMALLTIADNEPVDIQTVSQALGRDKSQISRLLKRLDEKGLIKRKRCPSDGRTILLELTKDGQRQLKSITQALTSIIGDALEPLSTSERKSLGDALAKVVLSRID
ncbi:MAG: MarR family transcriptional regulator [Pseudomonadota bacterium]